MKVKIILLGLLIWLSLIAFTIIGKDSIAGNRKIWHCDEWKTETYQCGRKAIRDSSGKIIGTEPIMCEREKCIRGHWELEPASTPGGAVRG